MLESKRILLVINGSIAAYKSLELIRLLTKAGASVEGLLTHGGAQFVTPLSVETLTGKRAHVEMWDKHSYEMNHIELSRRADLIVVAPATAGFIAKMALGIGDDLASSVMLAKDKPVIVAPSMNVEMWENSAFQRNLAQIQADGAGLIEPQVDVLACGEAGIGKMAEPQTIFDRIANFFNPIPLPLKGRKAIVTTGGTIERIDTVRYISNFSSGKQGNSIAQALANAGAEVTLVAGNIKDALPHSENIKSVTIESAKEMHDAVHGALPADIFVSCAAVCDFHIANTTNRKIKKEAGLDLQFEENPDIAKSVGTLKPNQRPKLVIGFAAETDDLISNAQKKLTKKGCDLIVANNVSNGSVFGSDRNQVSFVTADSVNELDEMNKTAVATELVKWINGRLES